ncbi:hypothetical protein ABIA53_005024 [Pseudomonas monsensis]
MTEDKPHARNWATLVGLRCLDQGFCGTIVAYFPSVTASMSCNSQKIRTLRQQIPSFDCVPGCHDCCGPVTTSPEEMARLPRKTRAEQDAALEALNCVHLGPNGCTVYEERPLICRLFGTTKTLPCPNGRGPVELIHPRVEKQIFEYMASNRQVLV